MLWQILRSHFEQKCDHGFFGSWLYAFRWEKTIENHKYIVAGACKVENLVVFFSILTLIFPIFREHKKGAIYILKVLERIAKILKVLKACIETAHVFCVALYQSIELFHLELHCLYICVTPHQKIKPLLIAKYKKLQIRNG